MLGASNVAVPSRQTMSLTPFFATYVTAWSLACVVAVVLAMRSRGRLSLFSPGYRALLFTPWKVVTFAAAAVGLTLIAPISGDPTWDYFDAAMMSVLTFLTAPWAVAVIYRALRGRETAREVFIAACVWMFSASWCYDLYILLRDGSYPITWAANIAASSILYACAGMMWSLEWRSGRGVIFAFMAEDWPSGPQPGNFRRLALYAIPFMLLVSAMIVPFVLDHMRWW